MKTFDIYAVSSRWEGFCNAMVEAAAAGKPVIASDIQTLNEVIGEENALFFPVGDWQALSDRISTFVEQDDVRQDYSEKARNHVRSSYSLETSSKNYEELYASILGLA